MRMILFVFQMQGMQNQQYAAQYGGPQGQRMHGPPNIGSMSMPMNSAMGMSNMNMSMNMNMGNPMNSMGGINSPVVVGGGSMMGAKAATMAPQNTVMYNSSTAQQRRSVPYPSNPSQFLQQKRQAQYPNAPPSVNPSGQTPVQVCLGLIFYSRALPAVLLHYNNIYIYHIH